LWKVFFGELGCVRVHLQEQHAPCAVGALIQVSLLAADIAVLWDLIEPFVVVELGQSLEKERKHNLRQPNPTILLAAPVHA
jgi:hypothetical protein